jgi:NAD(P)H-flavin reductase
MKDTVFTLDATRKIAKNTYEWVLSGNCSDCRAGGFVNIKLDGFYLRRPISVCNVSDGKLTLIFKVIGEGTPKEIFTNTALVREAGLELPQCAALLGELRARGVELDGAGITPDECADIIIKKLQNREEE